MYPQASNPLHDHRWLLVDALAANQQILADYPHRYVFLAVASGGGELTSTFSQGVAARLFWAVEVLETQGWEPAAWDLNGQSVGVVMRRAGAGAGTGYEITSGSGQWT